MTRFDIDRVRRYYERHTPAFVALGQGGSSGTLHRAVWGPGVTDRAGAFRFVEDRIADVVSGANADAAPAHVVDLGCGVGGSLCYLATTLPISGTGITLSPVQAALANERIAAAGLASRLAVVAGDYSDLPPEIGPADLAFAIESFVHAPDPEQFFGQCHRLVRPGGALVICDDFRRPASGAAARRAIERFCRGWHINTLIERDRLRALAAAAGFEHESTTDLSAFIEIGRWRDRVVDVLAPVVERWPWRWSRADPWLGGSALQACLRHGWVGYDLAVFRRR